MPKEELLPVELFRPDEEQALDIKRLAALGYTAKKIAIAMGLERDEMLLFLRDAATPGTAVAVLMLQGITETQAARRLQSQTDSCRAAGRVVGSEAFVVRFDMMDDGKWMDDPLQCRVGVFRNDGTENLAR